MAKLHTTIHTDHHTPDQVRVQFETKHGVVLLHETVLNITRYRATQIAWTLLNAVGFKIKPNRDGTATVTLPEWYIESASR